MGERRLRGAPAARARPLPPRLLRSGLRGGRGSGGCGPAAFSWPGAGAALPAQPPLHVRVFTHVTPPRPLPRPRPPPGAPRSRGGAEVEGGASAAQALRRVGPRGVAGPEA